ncbi:tandem-95 repeat protein [Sulfurospirillum sp. T05]|uniref:Tandem-95 repeat protein n=1 Tax=Sulfurospirillum tamanense TaxID=2813362 RepID=A0ABS2WTY4_9BACT|nr:BapA/Bap/LapF family large adhesin [Sulfurospirillum tamanensis]MBN2965126.1 tandem-95 repeat protein [Sulfurospirillum tamanensis]
MATVVGFVTQITGVVRAVSADGTVRVLVMGDPVHANETLETVGQNSGVSVLFEDGRQIAMQGQETSLLDDSVYNGQGYAESEVQAIQEALAQGQTLEEAAAGEEGPASDGGSGDIFVAERTGDLGDIGSYILPTDFATSQVEEGAEDGLINVAPTVFDVSAVQIEVLDGQNVISGQLLVTDTNPNDTHEFFAVEDSLNVTTPDGVAIEGLTFVLNLDGSYTITGDFNALAVGEEAVVTFQYFAVDNFDAVSQTATFTLTITGTNDQPVVSDVNANGGTFSWLIGGIGNEDQGENEGQGDYPSLLAVQSNVDLETLNAFISTGEGSTTIQEYFTQEQGYDPYDGSALKLTLGVSAGETVVFNWTFFDAEGGEGENTTDFNDFSFVVINGEIIYPLANSAQEGNQNNGTFSYTFSEGGTHEIVFGVMNDEDSAVSSSLQVTHVSGGEIIDAQTAGHVETLEGSNLVHESADPQSDTEDVYTTFEGTLPAVQDDDTNDTHTYEAVEESLHVNNELVTDLTVTVNADGTYSIQGNFNALAAGETATVTFQYVANDGRGFDGTDGINESSISEPATVTLTITGTNDRPVVEDVSDTQNEALNGLNTFAGTLVASDEDATDTHTYALVEESATIDNELITEYSVEVNEDGTYSVSGDFNALATGESATITFQYTATDSSSTQANGESDTSAPATVTLVVTGTNDQPVVEDVTAVVTEASLLDTPREDSRYEGQLSASDADASDTHTFSIDSGTYRVSITTVDSQGAETVTTLAPWAVSILMLTNQLSIDLNAETGEYSVYSTWFNTLGANQSMSVSFDYRANDGQGFSGDSAHENSLSEAATATLVVQGTNDQPVAFPDNVSAWEAFLANTPSEDAMFAGRLPFALDEDTLDNFDLTYVGVDADENGVIDTTTTGPVDDAGAPVVDPSQTVVTINPDGTYSVVNPTFNGLAAGESATVTFQYYVNDGSGAVAGANPHESPDSEPQTITLTIRGTNDRPVVETISDEENEALEGTNTFTGTLTATDEDVNDTHTFHLRHNSVNSDNPLVTGLSVILAPNGEYSVSGDFNALAVGESATITFQYRANDGSGSPLWDESRYSSYETVTLTVTGTNDAPVISEQSVTSGDAKEAGVVTDEGITTPVAAVQATGTLVATDVDNGATLTWTGDDAGTYGNFAIDATTGEWTYTIDSTPGSLADQLAQGETKTETFTATVTDEHGATDIQTVTITVTGTNDAPIAELQDDLNAVEDGTLITGQLVANDIDNDDNAATLTYTLVGDAPAGFVLNSDGSYSFDPSDDAYQSLGVNETADVTFTWIATDRHGASSEPQEVTITVTGVNDAPVATDDGKPNFTFGALSGSYYAVDSEHNGLEGSTYNNNNSYLIDNLTEFKHIVATTDPAATFEATKVWYGYGNSNGVSTGNSLEAFLNHDGASLNYTDGQTNTPEGGVHISGSVYIKAGTYNFKVLADDGYEILVNGESVAKYNNNQSPSTRTHDAFTIDADGWYDIEMYWWDQGGEYVFKPEISADGGLTYTALSNEGTYVTPEDTAFTFQPEELLANDFDIDGDTLTIISVSNAVNGTVELNEDGTITFTPAENFNGIATFEYTISDGNGGEDSATVTLHVSPVNDAPVAVDDALETSKDIPLIIPVADLLENDSDVDGDTLSIISVGDATNGTVTLNGDGTITFTPTGGFSGDATFTYTVSDGNGGTDTATVTITIDPGNSDPTITVTTGNPENANDTVSESGLAIGSNPSAAAIVATGVFSIADADGLDDITSITLAGTQFTVNASDGFAGIVGESADTQYGTVTVTSYNGNGNFSYTYELSDPATNDAPPAPTHVGAQDSFTVVVSDGEASAEATITIDITDDTPQSFSNEATLSVAASEVLVGGFAAGWVNVDTTGNSYTGTNLDTDAYKDKIEWGDPVNPGQRSGYVFTDNEALRSNNGVEIDTEFTLGTFIHNNFKTWSGTSTLESADLEVKFMVTINGQSHLITHTIQFEHEETPNNDVDPLEDADVVTIKNATFQTEINGQTYTFSILGFVDGSGNPVTTVHTLENQANSFELVAKISSTDALPTVSDSVGHVGSDWGADGAASAQSITWENEGSTIESGAIQGTYGTLTVDANGNYTYTLDRDVKDSMDADETLTEEFTYYLTDGDGDPVASTLTVTINGQATLDAIDNLAAVTIDEVAIAPAPTTEEVLDTFKLQGSSNSYNNRTLTKTEQFSIEEDATGNLNFSVDVTTVGGGTKATYSWTLFEIVDGVKTAINGSGATLNSDGSIAVSGLDAGDYEISITTNVHGRSGNWFWGYDYPSVEVSDVDLIVQPASYTETQATDVSGNILSDDMLGSVNTTLSIFTEGDFEAASGSGTTVAGEYGTLTIFANGDYTYTPIASLNNVGQVESFTYQLTHPSGATDKATLDIRLDSTTLNVVWGGEGELTGTTGDDILVPTLESTLIDGGDGLDTLVLSEDIDLSNVHNIEILKLDTDTPISLTAEDVFNLTDENNVLIVSGEGDVQIAVDGLDDNEVWTKNDAASTPEQSVYEAVYNGSDITLIIDQTVDTDIL